MGFQRQVPPRSLFSGDGKTAYNLAWLSRKLAVGIKSDLVEDP